VSPNFPELEQKAEEVRGRVALHPQDPVPEIVGVLEQLGLRVIVRPLGKDGPQGIYARRADFAAVLLNGSDYLPRFRFSGAHELGHHVLDHFEAHIDVDFSETTGKEKEANAFAASFLMPRRALWDRVANLGKKLTADQVRDLANEFIVSYDSMVNRLHNVQLLQGYQHRDALKAERASVLTDELRERRPAERWRLPTDYVHRALEAYGRYDISLDRLAELVEREAQEVAAILAAQHFLHAEDAA
jgi:Zn-dependent peptidase ImmA (M78 family)